MRTKSMPNVKLVDTKTMTLRARILAISLLFAFVLLLLDFYLTGFDVPTAVVYLPIVMSLGISPYFVYQYFEYSRMKSIEAKFPEFLRNLAETQRSGINLSQAIYMARKTDYGPLSQEIGLMADQLSWGIPFPKVIEHMEHRLSESTLVKRAMVIIREAYHSGGDIADVMESVSTNAVLIKDLESERQSKLSQQVLVMYVIFFIFLGMLVVLQKVLAPLFVMQSAGASSGGASFLSLSAGQFGPSYYRSIFLNMILIQGFFSGLIAGQLGEGKALAGIKHSAIMLVAGLAIFTLAVPPITMVMQVNEPATSFKPGSVFEMTGYIYYGDGAPVRDASVFIDFQGETYRLGVDEVGAFSYQIKLPSAAGVYQIKLSAENLQKKRIEKVLEATVQ